MLTDTLFATLTILASDLLLGAAFAGVGLGVRRAAGLRSLSVDDCLLGFWVGLAAVLLGLMAAHFFVPIGGGALLFVLAGGGLSLWSWRGELRRILGEARAGVVAPWAFAFALVAFWVANASLAPMNNSDTAGYHLPAIRWVGTYPVVPGLANLFGPLGFNNVSFLYGALLESPPWRGIAHHLANGTLILPLLARGLVAARRLLRPAGPADAARILELVLAAPAVVLLDPETLSSLITDGPTTLVMLAVIPLVYRELRNEGEVEERRFRVLAISMLLALGVCMKMHAGIFAALAWPLVMGNWIAGRRRTGLPWWRTAVTATLMVAAFAGLWMARGIVMSGYPMFPLPLLGVAVEWRVPAEHAQAEHAFVLHSVRASVRTLGVEPDVETLRGWVPHWWRAEGRRNPFELSVPMLLAAVGGIVYGWWRVLAGDRRGFHPLAFALHITVGLAIAGWFVAAPAPRYAMYLFWTLAALAWLPQLTELVSGSPGWRRRVAVVGIALTLSPAVGWPTVRAVRLGTSPIAGIVRMNLNRAPPGRWFQPLHEPETRVFTTPAGLVLRVPLAHEAGRCWRTPLPCTPNPAFNLVLRDPADMRHGFRVDGEWSMIDWPYASNAEFLPAWRASRSRTGRQVP